MAAGGVEGEETLAGGGADAAAGEEKEVDVGHGVTEWVAAGLAVTEKIIATMIYRLRVGPS